MCTFFIQSNNEDYTYNYCNGKIEPYLSYLDEAKTALQILIKI